MHSLSSWFRMSNGLSNSIILQSGDLFFSWGWSLHRMPARDLFRVRCRSLLALSERLQMLRSFQSTLGLFYSERVPRLGRLSDLQELPSWV